ncbi:hypothetical protein OF83DRAFT_1064160 [Amylostereum chailletii]|nr:hypothetical protein OF83DRAFT_1064160 [Amylostereum chailletii]
MVICCDASLSGLGFWSPQAGQGFASTLPPTPNTEDTIFWYEALCVLAALSWAAALPQVPSKLLIYTDNLNTVQIFDSFKARAGYNDLLFRAAEILMASHINLRVHHIPGEKNTVADALSRGLFNVVRQYEPSLRVHGFSPPRSTLGSQG